MKKHILEYCSEQRRKKKVGNIRIIYGEGWKVISSFSLAEETGIMVTDRVDYFGDIDPEGFVIYQSLKENYPEYEIHLQTEFYRKTIDAVRSRKQLYCRC